MQDIEQRKVLQILGQPGLAVANQRVLDLQKTSFSFPTYVFVPSLSYCLGKMIGFTSKWLQALQFPHPCGEVAGDIPYELIAECYLVVGA